MTEYFQTYDEDGRPTGQVPRAEVHAKGLWHRSVNVFVFHPDGRLYLQKRSADKDVWPGAWDLSVGEHLKPGETVEQAARRGLDEELSIRGIEVEPWGPEIRFKTVDAAKGVHDHEIQQCFRAVYDGEPRPDPEEVSEVRLMAIDELKDRVAREPERFTPWLRNCLAKLL